MLPYQGILQKAPQLAISQQYATMQQARLDETVSWHQFGPIIQRVLGELPWSDLLRMELVCRAWRNSSASSSEELVVGHPTDSMQQWLRNNSSRLLNVAVER
jgi:hypothetical protein